MNKSIHIILHFTDGYRKMILFYKYVKWLHQENVDDDNVFV